MLKSLAHILRAQMLREPVQKRAAREEDAPEEEGAEAALDGLAMTDELRNAIFPKTPQMVSAIFDRPASLTRQPASSEPKPAAKERSFPILF